MNETGHLFFPRYWLCSQLLSTVRAIDVLSVDDEALVGQGEGAFLAIEAVLVPGVTLVVHHVGPMAKPCIMGDSMCSIVMGQIYSNQFTGITSY